MVRPGGRYSKGTKFTDQGWLCPTSDCPTLWVITQSEARVDRMSCPHCENEMDNVTETVKTV